MFILRNVCPEDLGDLYELSKELNTINLPHDQQALTKIVDFAVRSFSGEIDPLEARYFFVLEDTSNQKVIGTSMIIAAHGTPADPHNYLRVDVDERYSSQFKRVFRHDTLTLRQSYTPHTEIGALVLSPNYRGHPFRLGKLLSYVRFLYMGVFRSRFQSVVEAELLPPFLPNGCSEFWRWYGHKFTDLSYKEADKISLKNQEFIRELFPRTPVYVSLMPKSVQDVIGAINPNTQGVARMLRSIGFAYNNRIDPFDGGPHFSANLVEITLVRDTFHLEVSDEILSKSSMNIQPETGLIARLSPRKGSLFKAVPAYFERRDGRVVLTPETRELLELSPGETIGATSFPIQLDHKPKE